LDKLIDNLNHSQKEAVLYNAGPSLVIAGAGSGKTRVLTHKIACLLRDGYTPWSILALTFTNKAAREMKERIATLVDPESAARLWMGTFHSLFYRILRNEADAIGFPSGFTIYDASDSKNLLKSIVKEMGLDEKTYKTNAVYSRISGAKNDLISPEAYAGNAELIRQDIHSKRPAIKDIYLRYANRCKMASAMDFDDLLFQTNILFRDRPDILERYQDQFQFILVDEYQDTNFSQYLIVKKLAEKHHRVCVVGDDSQSIYSFRGANIENILNFRKTYPEGKLFKLEQNYRSTKTIVDAANSLISKNKGQIPKKVFSEKEQGAKIRVLTAYSDLDEGFMVANKISEMHLSRFDSFNDFVILYRTNAQSRIFEESLRKRGIPYRIYGGLSFYQRKEIKDVVAYLRLLINADDEEAFKRVINFPARGIGDTTLQKLLTAATEHRVSLWTVLSDPTGYQLPINSGTARKLEGFREIVDSLRAEVWTLNVYELTQKLLNTSGIQRELELDRSPENQNRKENIQALMAGMNEFVVSRTEEGNEAVRLPDYLQEIALLTDQDEGKNAEGERVTLMTIHAAKGLEFKNVFVAGLEEDLFPSPHCLESEKDLEEERRLLYVAITRAESACVLSFARSRFKNGQNNFTRPSRFLKDLDASLLDYPTENALGAMAEKMRSNEPAPSYGATQPRYPSALTSAGGKPLKKLSSVQTEAQPSGEPARYASDVTNLKVGSLIAHERFGQGTIRSMEGSGDNAKIEVDFENAGYRKLLLKFARFTVVTP
jgi:DNA helicase-2/ATP-dependent DNA helicase PcrA